MTFKQGDWYSHTDKEEQPEFKGRICVKQKAGGWAVIRESEEIGGPAKGFCSLPHGEEPARGRVTTQTKLDALIENYERRARQYVGTPPLILISDVVADLKALR